MKFLITGGCGFLGSNLSHECLKRDEELAILDNLTRSGSNSNLEWLKSKGCFSFYQNDVRDSDSVGKVVRDFRPDVIFHSAGQVGMTSSLEDPCLDFETNVCGTFHVLESIRKFVPQCILIFSSTNKVYGTLDQYPLIEKDFRYEVSGLPLGFDENTRLDFHSPYGCSKGAADQYVLDYSRMFGLRSVVFRHSSIFGVRQFSTLDQGWVGWFIKNALDIKSGKLREPLTISGNGKQVRDVLFSEDLVSCYFSAVREIEAIKGQPFNIGGGIENSLSLIELFQTLENKLDVKLSFNKLAWRCSDQKVFVADITKAKSLFAWRPKVDKATGLQRMIEWMSRD